MQAKLPPVIHFRGQRGGRLHYAVTTGAEAIAVDGETIPTGVIGELGGRVFRSASFDVLAADEVHEYRVDGVAHRFHTSAGDVRLAYASCNGGEDEGRAQAYPGGRNALWREMTELHGERPFHLLVMGGDQIYADEVWQEPELAAWRARPKAQRMAAPFTDDMLAATERFFLRRYTEVWSAPEIARALATIPAVMMWDDHDICDGWGSHSRDWQDCDVVRGMFAVARRAFALFQLGCDADAPPDGFHDARGRHFGWSGDYGGVRIVVPDLRSERTRDRVMDRGVAPFRAALESGAARTLVVSTIPLVNADLSPLERLVRFWPGDLYQDDLRDQWTSYAHEDEWRGLMDALFAVDGPVSVLSGEIHLAAHGTAVRGDARIEQYIASGIAHPPPPAVFGRVMHRFTRSPARRGDTVLRMHELGETGRRYLAVRNWLEMTVASDGGEQAVLHAEGVGTIPLAPGVSAVERQQEVA